MVGFLYYKQHKTCDHKLLNYQESKYYDNRHGGYWVFVYSEKAWLENPSLQEEFSAQILAAEKDHIHQPISPYYKEYW